MRSEYLVKYNLKFDNFDTQIIYNVDSWVEDKNGIRFGDVKTSQFKTKTPSGIYHGVMPVWGSMVNKDDTIYFVCQVKNNKDEIVGVYSAPTVNHMLKQPQRLSLQVDQQRLQLIVDGKEI